MTDQCFRCYLAGGLAVLIPVAYLMFVNVLIEHFFPEPTQSDAEVES